MNKHNEDSLSALQQAIRNTLVRRMDLTRNEEGAYQPTLKYKEHIMTHMVDQIRTHGPLTRHSSSFGEHYHTNIKRSFGSSKCTINPITTILRRLDTKIVINKLHPPRQKLQIITSQANLNDTVERILVGEIHYKPGDIITNYDNTTVPSFLQIRSMSRQGAAVLLHCVKKLAQPLKHLGLYSLSPSNQEKEILFGSHNLHRLPKVNCYKVVKSSTTCNVVSLHNYQV